MERLISVKPTSVVVAEPHPLYLRGEVTDLRADTDIKIVGQACTGREALELLTELRPDVALLAIQMPDALGTEILREIGDTQKVVFLTAEYRPARVLEAMLLGARGYIFKSNAQNLTDTVIRVHRGEIVLCPLALGAFMGAVRERMRTDIGRELLSPREREILTLIADGYSQPQVAKLLRISLPTVKNHMVAIFNALDVKAATAAVAKAIAAGLIPYGSETDD